MENTKRKKGMPVIVEVLLATLVTMALVISSPYTMLAALMLAAMPGAYVTAKHGWLWGAVVMLAGTIVCYVLDPVYGVMYFALTPLALTLGVSLKRKVKPVNTFAYSAAAAVAGIAIVVLTVKLFSGKDIITYAMDAYKTVIAENDAAAGFMYLSVKMSSLQETVLTDQQQLVDIISQISAMQVSEMREVLLSAPQLMLVRSNITSIVPVIFSGAMYGAIFSYILTRLMVRRAGRDVAELPSFDRFIVPKKISPYLVITFVIIYIPIIFGIEKLYFVAEILYALLSPILMVQGASLVYYLFRRIIRKRGLAVVLTIIAVVLMRNICVFIGLFEQIMRVREKRFNREA